MLWERVCGADAAKVTKAEKLRGKILFISTLDHIWAAELSHFESFYVEKYNKLVGAGVVEDIRFQAKPSAFLRRKKKATDAYDVSDVTLTKKEQKEIEEITLQIKDERLRKMAEKFLCTKKKSEKWLIKHGGVKCFGCGAIIEKGRTFCLHCLFLLENKNREALLHLMEDKPWLSFKEVLSNIGPVSIELYDEIKKQLLNKLYGEVVESVEKLRKSDDEKAVSRLKGKIITVAMLKSGRKPAELSDEVLRKILPEAMYNFFKER